MEIGPCIIASRQIISIQVIFRLLLSIDASCDAVFRNIPQHSSLNIWMPFGIYLLRHVADQTRVDV